MLIYIKSVLARTPNLLPYIGGAGVALLLQYTVVPRFVNHSDDYSYIQEVKQRVSRNPVIAAGRTLSIKGIDLSSRPYTWILFTSPDCNFCVQSAEFHRRLYNEAKRLGTPLLIAVPRAQEAQRFLRSSGIATVQTIDWEQINTRPQGTPSIALINSVGGIRRLWLGQLSPDEEEEVVRGMASPASVAIPLRHLQSGEAMLTPRDLKQLSLTEKITRISIAERATYAREHTQEDINIPLAELAARAPLELDRKTLTLIDCTAELDPRCSLAVKTLIDLGFRTAAFDASGDASF